MLWNYLKIALRTLQRNTSYAVINVMGLALGVGIALAALFLHLQTFNRMAGTALSSDLSPAVALGLVGLAVDVKPSP